LNTLFQVFRLIGSGASSGGYYEVMNQALKRLSGDYTMLHYPYFKKKGESFYTSQVNLTEFCLSKLTDIQNKKVLEIGCGNGIQAAYIAEKYKPEKIIAVDLNEKNIEIARTENLKNRELPLSFLIDDAQNLKNIPENSIDAVVNIESAFHYPEKNRFLKEIARVLKPGGEFLIADILTTDKTPPRIKKFWKKKMVLHHWHLDKYLAGFENSGLIIKTKTDITEKVIRGFRNYPYWLKNLKKGGFFNDLVFRLFYWINIRLNIYLLKKHRQYYVFAGIKPG
jgi:SAM-dependent methyltransferase